MPGILIGGFLGLMSLGVPLAIVIIGTGLIYIMLATPAPLTVVAQRLFVGMDDFTLMAIPLFVLAGYLMNEVGLTERLVRLTRYLLRKIYGGLAQVAVLVSMIFGGVSGAAAADLAAVGITMIPEMQRDGYKREFSVATITAASLMGAVIPPSIPFIIYGVQSQTSIGDLFIAGIIPGILIGVTVMVTNYVLLRRQGFVTPTLRPDQVLEGKDLAISARDALIALFMPVLIIGGILGGVFTPTEAAAVAVFYALIVGLVYRTLNVEKALHVLRASVVMTATVMIIVASSSVLNWALAYSRLPSLVAELMLAITDSQTVFLLIALIVLLLVGMPLDPVPAIIIVTPVLLPAAISYGVDPVHFGVVTVLALTLGLATPPVGASLFVAMSISKVPMGRLSVAVMPFIIALLALTVLITFVPQIYNWLLA
ncbi:TRAP transporter large permease [Pseudarthrobacter sp. NamE2]|uniref:TRAP transporter large permease n=1 Tax=Pseudarthrobacter sp. NamE2 TaxID=2576838 RepID=UPI0010FEB575|nr:TRAP transporter large permease [Pseudarthrobacter sp. NamE2]TLM86605.1 TRAP transporter large permease [Pseudarthrobacter sp. NamE2]